MPLYLGIGMHFERIKLMKVSDIVAKLLHKNGIDECFVVQGGASAHLIDSIAKESGMRYICCQHEQACAMAADGYARANNKIGCAISTSGPGALNLITGCAGAFYDSVPVIFLTGQVATFRDKGELKIRQLGFQETDTTEIFKPITKYAVKIKKAENIKFEINKAVSIALSGRKGPVLIDIPDDIQRSDLDIKLLKEYTTTEEKARDSGVDYKEVIRLITEAEKPLIVAGWGIHLASAENEFVEVIKKLKIPVALTWGAVDLLPDDDLYRVGTFGINGTRYGNYSIQAADLIIVLGSRLDTHVAGTPLSDFSPYSQKIIVDIDYGELEKYEKLNFSADIFVNENIFLFLKGLLEEISLYDVYIDEKKAWLNQIKKWKNNFPISNYRYEQIANDFIDPYYFMSVFSNVVSENDTVFLDTGCSLVWFMQAFRPKKGQRVFSDLNNTCMGYSLPASVGAAVGCEKKIICISGDGGLMMNIQELATVVRHDLNIKLIIFNNNGYGMIQRTQDMWFGSRYEGSDTEHGLGFPDFLEVISAFGIRTCSVTYNKELFEGINEVYESQGPYCLLVNIPINSKMEPYLKPGDAFDNLMPYVKNDNL